MNGQNYAVSNNWLDNGTTTGTTTGTSVSIGGLLTEACYQPYPSYPYYVTLPAPRPIKLTMADVERLRKAAKSDDKLKTVLAKFTDLIEVVVDFD